MKKYTKWKEQFPHEEALEKFLVSQFENYNQRFATRCHLGFDQARAELEGDVHHQLATTSTSQGFFHLHIILDAARTFAAFNTNVLYF